MRIRKVILKSKRIIKIDKIKKLSVNYINLYRIQNKTKILEKYIDYKNLFNWTFNFKVPNKYETKFEGRVEIVNRTPKKIINNQLHENFNNLFKKLEHEHMSYKKYKGFYFEEIDNAFVLKHTNT